MKRGTDYIGVGIGAVIFDKEGNIFLAKRGKKARNEIGKWGCPGGTLEFGESFENTLIREMKEEFDIDIEVLDQLAPFNHVIPQEKQHWVALAFICRIKKGTPKILEPEKCEEIGWFTIEEMKRMPLAIASTHRLKQILDKKYPNGLPFIHRGKTNKVITICSSASFYKNVLEIEKQLKKLGFKVKIPQTAIKMRKSGNFNVEDYKTWFKNKEDYKRKTKFMNDHLKKVIQADAILVVNNEKNGIPGYIGGNVLMEMTLAHHLKKKIFIWNEATSDLPIEEEVRGLNPVFIHQDVSQIFID